MSNEVKFTKEELESISNIRTTYQNIQAGFGQLKVQRLLLEQQLGGLEEAEINLESEYTKAQDNERAFVASLNEKYGPGTLDPNTGVFTPAPTIETEVEEPTEEATGAPK